MGESLAAQLCLVKHLLIIEHRHARMPARLFSPSTIAHSSEVSRNSSLIVELR